MSKKRFRIFHARIIHSKSIDQVEDFKKGALVCDDAGVITEIGSFDEISPKYPDADIVQLADKLIIPGLIDTHLHLPQLDQRGKHGATLLEWLKKYIFPCENAFKDPNVAEDAARRFFKKLILNGTTTAVTYTTIHEESTNRAFELARQSGLRIVMGKVMMDQHSPEGLLEDTNESLAASERLCSKWHGAENGRLMYAYTPRFAPTCSKKMWNGLSKLMHDSGAYMQTHIAETIGENKRVKELFPEYKDYVELFEDTNTLGDKTILAHAIHLSEDEIKRLAKSKTKVAHCPTSNLFLKSGRMPIELIDKYNVTYGLGTDVGAGPSFSLFTTMRHADYVQPDITIIPRKAFYLATQGGADVLSLGNKLGNFVPGKMADLCVINIKNIDYHYDMDLLDTDEILS
ncbi:guanine deaminase, partial [bacterium]|nr:guanine deaminase [bacterium]